MTKQQAAFAICLVFAVLCAVFALISAAPGLAVGRDFLFLGAAAFTIAALRQA